MAFIQYLSFNGVDLPCPTSYEVNLADVEADSSGETEAGTTQRDILRSGMVEISVAFLVTAKWMKKLTEYKQMCKIQVAYFNPETAEADSVEMYIDGYKVKLEGDTSYKGLWSVSFTLKEF